DAFCEETTNRKEQQLLTSEWPRIKVHCNEKTLEDVVKILNEDEELFDFALYILDKSSISERTRRVLRRLVNERKTSVLSELAAFESQRLLELAELEVQRSKTAKLTSINSELKVKNFDILFGDNDSLETLVRDIEDKADISKHPQLAGLSTRRQQMVVEIVMRHFGINPLSESAEKVLESEANDLLSYIQGLDGTMLLDTLEGIANSGGAPTWLGPIPGAQGHYLKTEILIRECYWSLARTLLREAGARPVCVTGDPGIGKSFFAFLMFIILVYKSLKVRTVDQRQPQKYSVMLVSVGGSAFYYDTDTITFQATPSNEWRKPTTWLLLDGWAPVSPFSDKQSRVVVFASPKQKNYHELVKVGSILNIEHVKTFMF
ncbi:hypothetical protein HDV05_002150, partial [Chytridiales sp. JEL 0842]